MKRLKWGVQSVSMVDNYLGKVFDNISFGTIHFMAEGWDYRCFLSENNYVIRAPKNPAAQTHLQYEMAKLKTLTLPLAVPQYIQPFGRVGVYPAIFGEAVKGKVPNDTMVQQLQEFLEVLHQDVNLPPQARSIKGVQRWVKRFRHLHDEVVEKVYPLLSIKEQRRSKERFNEFFRDLSLAAWSCTLIHGDLSLEHILVNKDRVQGIIDFGDMLAGDPAYDLSGISLQWERGPLREYALRVDPGGRRCFYRWASPLGDVIHELDEGLVESVEQALEKFRRGN